MADVKSNNVNDSIKSVKAYIESQLIAGNNIQLKETVVAGKKIITISSGSTEIGYTEWGKIKGDIANQADLQSLLSNYALKSELLTIDGGNAQN